MKIHVHKLRDDGTEQCLESGCLGEGRVAELSFTPSDVTEPWTILVRQDEGDASGETVIVTMATSKQVERFRLGAKDGIGERLYALDGADGSATEVEHKGEQWTH